MIEPLNDLILVKRAEKPKESVGGIALLENDEPDNNHGVVSQVGPDVKSKLCRDDTVLFSKYAGTEVSYEGSTYLLIKEVDLLAKVRH